MDKDTVIQVRKALGLTQKELAAKLKVDAITVSRWERGAQRPAQGVLKRLERLARKAGIS